MRAALLVILFCSNMLQVHAQNLVKNFSLEVITNGAVENFRKVSGTPDIASKYDNVIQYPPYYNSYRADLPTRSVSNIRFGDVCLCQWFSESSSELTQAELVRPLKKNREYLVSLYTIKASVREPAISEVTVYFTKKRLPATRKVYGFKEHELTGQNVPYLSLTSATAPVLDSREDWVKVTGLYKAKGGERYLTIGNFIGANKQALEAMNPAGADTSSHGKIKGTYYCYDQISVVPGTEAPGEEQAKPLTTATATAFTVGSTITLSDVNFTTGSHQILPVAFPTLDSLTAFMNESPEVVVRVLGHTDDVGSDDDNLQLSVRRAQAVKQYLTGGGVAPDRITYRGYGESRPKVENDTDRNRALNRRVEIEIRLK